MVGKEAASAYTGREWGHERHGFELATTNGPNSLPPDELYVRTGSGRKKFKAHKGIDRNMHVVFVKAPGP